MRVMAWHGPDHSQLTVITARKAVVPSYKLISFLHLSCVSIRVSVRSLLCPSFRWLNQELLVLSAITQASSTSIHREIFESISRFSSARIDLVAIWRGETSAGCGSSSHMRSCDFNLLSS